MVSIAVNNKKTTLKELAKCYKCGESLNYENPPTYLLIEAGGIGQKMVGLCLYCKDK